MPQRLHRTRRRARQTPPGAVYVGRPTIWANPFDSNRFGHHAAFLLFEDWLTDRMSRRRLIRIGFGDDEIEALARRRRTMIARLADLRGRDLQCWCPLTVRACHAAVLLAMANVGESR